MASPSCTLRRRPILSDNERPADRILQDIGECHGFRIFPQVSLNRVIDLPPGLTARQWDYGTRASFDFVVCDAETLIPEFAVELDDGTHWQLETRRRDHMKDLICEKAGFELLRVESRHLRPDAQGQRLVEYLIDARAFSQNIYELQQQGSLPWDDIFDYRDVVSKLDDDGYLNYVNDLSGPARRAVRRAHRVGKLADGVVQTLSFDWRYGWSEGWAWVKAYEDWFLFAHTRVRSYPIFFCGISPGDLAEDLSGAALEEQLIAYGRGESVAIKAADIGERFARVRARRAKLVHSDFLDYMTWDGR